MAGEVMDYSQWYPNEIKKWTPNTVYPAGTQILLPDNRIGKAKTSHTSGQSFSFSNWDFGVEESGNDLVTGEAVMDRWHISTNAVGGVSGELLLTMFTAKKTESISKLYIVSGSTANAATPTLVRVGVYEFDSTANQWNLVGSSANDTTLFSATFSTYTVNLSTSFTKTAGKRYAIGILIVSAVAVAKFYGNAAVSSSITFVEPKISAKQTGLSDLPATIAPGAMLGSPLGIYAEVRP